MTHTVNRNGRVKLHQTQFIGNHSYWNCNLLDFWIKFIGKKKKQHIYLDDSYFY